MLTDGKSVSNSLNLECDICIIGAGPAGIVLANELAPYYSRIILVESGAENFESKTQLLYKAENYPLNYPDPWLSRLRFLGGASNHWANNTSPLSPIDFAQRDWIPNSGWPISYKDILPYYKKAEYYCGVDTDGYNPDYWLGKYKQIDWGLKNSALEFGIAKVGIPATNFFKKYAEKLTSSTNVQVLKNSNLIDIEFSKDDFRVKKIILNSFEDYSYSISANNFVMCLGGIENARMLLYFNLKNHNKLGNQNGNVGKYFMDHPTVPAAHLFSDKIEEFNFFQGYQTTKKTSCFFQLSEQAVKQSLTTNLRMPLIHANGYELSDGISSYHIMKQALKKGELPEAFSDHLVNFLLDFDMIAEAISRKSFNNEFFESAKNIAGFRIPMMLEQTPHPENRVSLGNVTDALGIPKININWKLQDDDKRRLWVSLGMFANEIGAHSIGRVRLLKERANRIFGDQMGFGHHHMGTTRMASSEVEGVVDKNQKVFGVDNLYISGSSVFTTSGHVPPTLTIIALTLRLAEHLLQGKKNEISK